MGRHTAEARWRVAAYARVVCRLRHSAVQKVFGRWAGHVAEEQQLIELELEQAARAETDALLARERAVAARQHQQQAMQARHCTCTH